MTLSLSSVINIYIYTYILDKFIHLLPWSRQWRYQYFSMCMLQYIWYCCQPPQRQANPHHTVANHNTVIGEPTHRILLLSPPLLSPCNIKTIFPCMRISMLKIRLSWDHLIFIMGILILMRQHLYIKTTPWVPCKYKDSPFRCRNSHH